MASNKEEKDIEKISKRITTIGKTYNELMDQISHSTTGSNRDREKEIDQISKELDRVISSEIDTLTKLTGNEISTFLVKLFNDEGQTTSSGHIKSMEDLFRADDNAMVSYFTSKQKEKRVLYNELDMIASQLYELKEAILVIRDSIITSDDISKTISRQISFDDKTDEELENASANKQVEGLEKKFKLHKKIKNFIVPKTLNYGEYFVYTIPYSELFKKFAEDKQKRMNGVMESHTVADILKTMDKGSEITPAMEMATVISNNLRSNVRKDANGRAVDKIPSNSEISKVTESILQRIEVYNENVPLPVMEGEALDELAEFKALANKSMKDAEKRSTAKGAKFADGVTSKKDTDFSFVTNDVYMKMIDPTKIAPIEIMDTCIGYYYAYEVNDDVLQPFSNTIKIVDAALINKETERTFLNQLTSKVVQAFDKPFLQKNEKFRELILSSLMYEEMYKKKVRFQFIPADYITKFSINEDDEGNGQSVLKDSLFYAKLYLALLIFKIIQILTKSSDTRVYYVRNSGLDADVMNGIQEAARQVKAKQINYYDIMNPVTSTSKLGNNNEIFIPYGRSQEKGMEFDILAGQDIQLNTDLMEMLKQAYINATGVPSVIMQYINEADYAKTLVMANSKFVGRVISLQADFNDALTDLYKKLLRFSTDMDEALIESFEFKFVSPKTINTQNMNDLTAATDQVVQYMIQSFMGANSDAGEIGNRLRDRLTKELSQYFLPTLPWGELKAMAERIMLELQKEDYDNKLKNGEDTDQPPVPSF